MWLRRYWERLMRDDVDYVHINPVTQKMKCMKM